MALIVPAVGEVAFLRYVVGVEPTTKELELRLFVSNHQPTQGDVLGTYTEADFTGYAPILIPAGAWTITQGTPSQAAAPQQIFTSAANQTPQLVYGYLLILASTATLVVAERFSNGPYSVSEINDRVRVTPQITMN
jgi:hypothetical protein